MGRSWEKCLYPWQNLQSAVRAEGEPPRMADNRCTYRAENAARHKVCLPAESVRNSASGIMRITINLKNSFS